MTQPEGKTTYAAKAAVTQPHAFESYCKTVQCVHCTKRADHQIHKSTLRLPNPYEVAGTPSNPTPYSVVEGDIIGVPADPDVPTAMDHCYKCLTPQGFPCPQDKGCAYRLPEEMAMGYNAVEPPHYKRGPVIKGHIGSAITMGRGEYTHAVQCIEVMEAIQDPRLATALKYIWRVAFGGKAEPWDSRTSEEVDARDINSAIWYLQRYLSNPPQGDAPSAG